MYRVHGRHPEHTQAILDVAAKAQTPIAAVVNSHWHLDHVGGNPLVRRAHPGVRVHASGAIDGALTGFLADYRKQLQSMIDKTPDPAAQKPWRAEIALIDVGAALGPDRKPEECVDGWATAVAPFLKEDDPKFVRGLLGY